MSPRTMLLALVLLSAAGWFWFSHKEKPAPQQAGNVVPTAQILVAAQPTQAGTLLKDVDFREKEIPAAEVSPDEFIADETSRVEMRGALLRRYLDANQVVKRQDILRPKDRGFLAAVLAPGTRAVSIGVDATTGAAGLISPGDLVDVILSQEFARGETPIGRRVVAETVLTAVRVIAVDQQITQGAPMGSTTLASPGTRIASTVSLQVTSDQAAKIVVAERLGRLTLAVRSIDGDPNGRHVLQSSLPGSGTHPEVSPGSVFGADVSSALSRDEPATAPKLRLIQGDAVNDVVFR